MVFRGLLSMGLTLSAVSSGDYALRARPTAHPTLTRSVYRSRLIAGGPIRLGPGLFVVGGCAAWLYVKGRHRGENLLS